MSERQITSPESMMEVMAASARINDRRPDFARLVSEITLDRLENGPKVEEKDPWKHVAQHFLDILPVVMGDPRVKGMMGDIAGEYEQVASDAETGANDDSENGQGDVGSLGLAAILGAQIAAFSIIEYCLGPAHIPPGTSAPIPHFWPFC